MIAPARYFDLVRDMKHPYDHRLRLVESAKQLGIKATAALLSSAAARDHHRSHRPQMAPPFPAAWPSRLARAFPCPRSPTSQNSSHRRSPTHRAPQTPSLLRSSPPQREFDLPVGHSAMERIWRVHGLMKKRRRKYQRKQDLAHIKAQWALFQQISADTKDLDDIPHYWPQAQALGLPAIQYTARDVRSGLLFWAFAEKRSASASAVFASRIQQHLHRYGVSLRDLAWQTDNGSEFKGDFPAALGDSQHVRISPAAHTFQSDVETVHRLEEDEFFDLEYFQNRGDFLAKVHTYQLYFNLARPNSHKEFQTPWQIIEP